MNKFFDKFMLVATKIGSQRHLVAIRDGFVSLMPLLMVGALATVINNFPISKDSTLSSILPSFITDINGNIWWGTFGMLALFIVFGTAYSLAKSYESDGLSAAVIAFACYMALVPQSVTLIAGDGAEVGGWGNISWQYTAAGSLFAGIIVALIATEIFVRLRRIKQLVIKLPDAVPPAVSRSFAALLPGVLTVIAVVLLAQIITTIADSNIFALITRFVSAPLKNVTESLTSALVIAFLTQFFWFFGLHGANIVGAVFEPISLEKMAENIAAYASGADIPNIVTTGFFNTYVWMGGTGVTLGLLIAIYIGSKLKQNRMIANVGIGPSLFNINEPVMFGLPLVLNPVYFVPFIVVPLLLTIISYIAVSVNIVGNVVALIPWATPPIISGLLSTGFSWTAPILQLINLAISVLIYLPFVKIADRIEQKKEQAVLINK